MIRCSQQLLERSFVRVHVTEGITISSCVILTRANWEGSKLKFDAVTSHVIIYNNDSSRSRAEVVNFGLITQLKKQQAESSL